MKKLSGKVIETKPLSNEELSVSLGRKLKELRLLAGMSQKELSEQMGITRSVVSRIENRNDTSVQTLKKYVEGLGAELQMGAAFDASSPVTLKIRDALDFEGANEDQLVFPLFEEETFKPKRDVVLSIKPQYSVPILQGIKTVELRRRFPIKVPTGTLAYIYSTSPTRALTGTAQILGVSKVPLDEMWQTYSSVAYIEKDDFDAYFSGLDEGYVIKLGNAHPLKREIGLAELRDRFDFEAPQSFVYAKPLLREALHYEPATLSH